MNFRQGSNELDSLSRREMSSLVILSVSEGSHALGYEILRGVYTERSECAQDDTV